MYILYNILKSRSTGIYVLPTHVIKCVSCLFNLLLFKENLKKKLQICCHFQKFRHSKIGEELDSKVHVEL